MKIIRDAEHVETVVIGGGQGIDLPVLGEHEPLHERGIVASEPGLYFVGLPFLYSLSSSMIHGVERDARYVADHVARRVSEIRGYRARPPVHRTEPVRARDAG